VNAWVNSHLRFVDDPVANGKQQDQWSTVNVSLVRGYGDCDDFTIAKYQILKSLGFPESDMYFILSRELVSRQDHAFLMVKVGNQHLVLDNLRSEVFTDERVIFTVFYPVMAYSRDSAWIFGIRNH
jgi:predicted transglutaminase-like cysteine proteinase